MVLLVIVLKAAAIATIQFSSMQDCAEAKKAMDGGMGKFSTEIAAVCIDKVAGAPAAGQ